MYQRAARRRGFLNPKILPDYPVGEMTELMKGCDLNYRKNYAQSPIPIIYRRLFFVLSHSFDISPEDSGNLPAKSSEFLVETPL